MGTRIDLQSSIYVDLIKPVEVFKQFVQILEIVDTKYSDRAVLRTRDNGNKVLGSPGKHYFTYVGLSDKTKPDTIFAGALEKPPRGKSTPIIRVRSSNPHLKSIPAHCAFPFERERNPEWTCVLISTETIETMKDLLLSEVEEYFRPSLGV